MIPQRFYGCLWAETKGKKALSKRIDIDVCGSEELIVQSPLSDTQVFPFRS